MKLTDQEQVILKAITSVGRNGLAEISKVVRAVGYPKETAKKVLARLNEKGIVVLHRHDWPQSLTPAQRKLMVRIGRDYFNAVSMRKRNPKSKTKTALKTTGRALKGLTKGALSAGAQILGAGATALNPSKRKRKKNKTVIKAKRVLIKRVCNPRKKKRVEKNAPRTVSAVKAAKHRARASSKTGPKKTAPRVRSVAKARKAPAKRVANKPVKKSSSVKEKRNPSAESIRKEFAGSVSGERDLFFPQGTPAGKLAKLGKLVSITTEEGTIKPVSGSAWLCADTKGKLHIGSTSGAPLFDGPARSFGHVTKLEYESSKPHLGYRGPIIWFHRVGEENKIRPTLRADGKGGLVFRGGDYRLTERGIEN